ncbi:non-canonical purine NTP pyrophosphatase [Aspergillus foveolatus]|uniref:non-canonical purine NTP pyrophosphatase n=1 Tax=Aspergillus foveolatus TaxID=210207 RepID=UPI003CCDDD37
MPDIVFITGNPHKVLEVKSILGDSVCIRPVALDLREIQGTSEEIVRDKCRTAAEMIGGPVLVEDSALEMHALNRLPGPYVKAFVGAIGNLGLCRLLEPYENKAAEAVCTLGYSAGPGSEPVVFQGRLLTSQGQIVSARGVSSFGWEPIFEFDGETLAEMDVQKKNRLSHWFRALSKFREWVQAGGSGSYSSSGSS